ncbi:MAG: hypothetical protein GXY33_12890 [Phycisphaerae bacterium]|nr:hypothetical protein [Phycisphaerae bacterium]
MNVMWVRSLLRVSVVVLAASVLAQAQVQEPVEVDEEALEAGEPLEYAFRGVDDFFNIREANPDVTLQEWEFQVEGGWLTRSGGPDDDVYVEPTVLYGITEDLFVSLGLLPIYIGDGGDIGNGDLNLAVFYRVLDETDDLPAVAGWAEMRIPSGEGSSGVDGTFYANLTKTITRRIRAHFGGFVMTANGQRGDGVGGRIDNGSMSGWWFGDWDNGADRRDFQWGAGPGFDYLIDEETVAVLNYLHRSSEYDGNSNMNILEAGVIREIGERQAIKAAVDVGLDGAGETPNLAGKIQYAISW